MPYNPHIPYRGDLAWQGASTVSSAIGKYLEKQEGLRDLAKGADNIRKGAQKAGIELPGLGVDDAEWSNLGAKDKVSRLNAAIQLYQMQQQQKDATSLQRYRESIIDSNRTRNTLDAVEAYRNATQTGVNYYEDPVTGERVVIGPRQQMAGSGVNPEKVTRRVELEKPEDIPGYTWGSDGKGGWKAYQIPAATTKAEAEAATRSAKNDPLAEVRKTYSRLAKEVAEDQARIAQGNLSRPGPLGGVNYVARMQSNIKALREIERLYPEIRGGGAATATAAPEPAAAGWMAAYEGKLVRDKKTGKTYRVTNGKLVPQ
jgi:hypothetical protein